MLILVGIIMIYPLLWMISATFKDNSEIFAGISLWIKKPTLDGYRNALNNFGGSINILQAMLNTYSYVIPKVICTVVSACIAAYGFGRFDFPGRKLLFNIMLATLFLPQVVLNVPQYLLYNKFGWVDSPFYLAIWVHCAFATETYFVYQLVQFMRNVPRDLDEAAAIDGCSSFQTLYKVIVPMLGPALVSCALFQFMWSCNDFMGPLLYVSTPGKYPMSLFVKLSMDGDTGFAWNKILALSLISILPQLIVFFCAQDQFVEGIRTSDQDQHPLCCSQRMAQGVFWLIHHFVCFLRYCKGLISITSRNTRRKWAALAKPVCSAIALMESSVVSSSFCAASMRRLFR